MMMMMRPLVFMFPGQGVQRVGMLRALKADPRVHELVEMANAICKVDIGAIIDSGPEVGSPPIKALMSS